MKQIQSLTSFLFLVLCSVPLQAQEQFFLNGSAVENDTCFRLTPEVNWEVGSIWYGELINLEESFEIVLDLFLGCKDADGADGIVFGLQPISTSIGVAGGDIGFGNVQPSLGVEFDTHFNADFADPTFDHITVIRDGILNHNLPEGALAGPVQANISDINIEDCMYHPMRLNWDATTQTLSVYLDCELRLTYTGDIINEIFNGDPMVYWGFTSATGGLNNIHEVCFSYTTLLDDLVDQTICPGESVQLEATGGVSYNWSPVAGLSDPTISNPVASPEESTLYTLEIIDECGFSYFKEVWVNIGNDEFELELFVEPNSPEEVSPGTELSLDVIVTPPDQGTYTLTWNSAIGSSFVFPDLLNTPLISSIDQLGTETITVSLTNENGCFAEASYSFEILGELYEVPNIFTPNGDDINDAFGILTNAELDLYNCKVFNRWGELVFESNAQFNRWDGLVDGVASPSDVYVYLMEIQIAGKQFVEKGELNLIR